MPITADFKGNMIARYMFPLGAFDAHVQGSLAYEGSRSSDLDIDDAAEFGDIPSNTFLDLSFGIENEKYAIELFVANATDEDSPLFFDAECAPSVCGAQTYGVMPAAADFRHPVPAGLLMAEPA